MDSLLYRFPTSDVETYLWLPPLIMFLIAGGTGLGTLAAVRIGARRLFDGRHRLCLDGLEGG